MIYLSNFIGKMIIEAYANISHVFIVPGAFHRLRKRIVPLALVPAGHGGWEGECVGGAWEVLSAPRPTAYYCNPIRPINRNIPRVL